MLFLFTKKLFLLTKANFSLKEKNIFIKKFDISITIRISKKAYILIMIKIVENFFKK